MGVNRGVHFLEARFGNNENILLHYKNLIKKHLAPDEPWKRNQQISLKEAKRAISHYKKATNDNIAIIDLMIYYIECGTDFLCEFGDMYEQYYYSLESMFDNVIKFMKKQDYQEMDVFIKRLKIILKKAEPMGWGYHDTLSDLFNEAYHEILARE